MYLFIIIIIVVVFVIIVIVFIIISSNNTINRSQSSGDEALRNPLEKTPEALKVPHLVLFL
jgi:preprotein translocase subunit SecG